MIVLVVMWLYSYHQHCQHRQRRAAPSVYSINLSAVKRRRRRRRQRQHQRPQHRFLNHQAPPQIWTVCHVCVVWPIWVIHVSLTPSCSAWRRRRSCWTCSRSCPNRVNSKSISSTYILSVLSHNSHPFCHLDLFCPVAHSTSKTRATSSCR